MNEVDPYVHDIFSEFGDIVIKSMMADILSILTVN